MKMAPESPPLRVLFLEDNPDDFELIQRELRRAGIVFTARLAEERAEFEKALGEFQPQVVLSDFTLPRFDGLSAMRSVHERAPDVPFIFVSGSIGEALAIETLAQGAADYIFKDNLARLGPAVTRVVADAEMRRLKREAEERLRKSEEYYRTLVETSPDAIVNVNAGGRITFASARSRELFGLPGSLPIADLPISGFVEPEEWPKVQARLAELLSGRSRPDVREYRLRRHDGRPFWGEIYSSPLRDAKGRITDLLLICRDVSERKRNEEALLRSEAKFRKIFEDHAAVKLLLDTETGAIVDANRAAAEYYGWSRDQLKAMNINEINTLPDADIAAAIRTVREQKRVHFEFRHRRADGSIRDVEVFSSKIEMDGRAYLHSIIHDITERRRAEERIRYQASLMQNVSDAIIATDENGAIRMWNRAAEAIYGWTPDEVIGKPFHDILDPGYPGNNREQVLDALKRDGVWSGEITHRLKDGRRIPMQSTISSLREASGRISGQVSVNHDISERKRAEQELHERDQLLQNLSLQIPGMIYTFLRRPDGSYCIPFSSSAILEIFGVQPQDVTQDASAIFPPIVPEDRPKMVSSIEESARNLTPWQAEYRVQLPGRPVRWMWGQSHPFRLEDGSVLWYGFNADITERKVADEMIRVSLREKEVLLKEIHHRVKNNLQVISGLLTMQSDRASGRPVADIFHESQDRIRSIALIHEKLYGSHNLSEIAFDEYLRALVDNLLLSHGIAAGGIRVAYDLEPVRFTIEKAIPLGLIVNELVTNAVKHAFPGKNGGEVRIGMRAQSGNRFSGPGTDSGSLRTGPAVELSVGDDGVGLPADFAIREQKSLGMSLVRMLARQIQAELQVKSGAGSEFHIIVAAESPKT